MWIPIQNELCHWRKIYKCQINKHDRIMTNIKMEIDRMFTHIISYSQNLTRGINLKSVCHKQTLPPGILKGEVSLYHWPPLWLVWNLLCENWQFLFLFANRLIQTSQTQKVNGTVFPASTLVQYLLTGDILPIFLTN